MPNRLCNCGTPIWIGTYCDTCRRQTPTSQRMRQVWRNHRRRWQS